MPMGIEFSKKHTHRHARIKSSSRMVFEWSNRPSGWTAELGSRVHCGKMRRLQSTAGSPVRATLGCSRVAPTGSQRKAEIHQTLLPRRVWNFSNLHPECAIKKYFAVLMRKCTKKTGMQAQLATGGNPLTGDFPVLWVTTFPTVETKKVKRKKGNVAAL